MCPRNNERIIQTCKHPEASLYPIQRVMHLVILPSFSNASSESFHELLKSGTYPFTACSQEEEIQIVRLLLFPFMARSKLRNKIQVEQHENSS